MPFCLDHPLRGSFLAGAASLRSEAPCAELPLRSLTAFRVGTAYCTEAGDINNLTAREFGPSVKSRRILKANADNIIFEV